MGKQLDPDRPTIKSASKDGRGRPRLAITPRDLHQIEQFAAIGMTRYEIAHLIEVSTRQMDRWCQQPEVADAIDRGRAKGLTAVGKKLYDKAIGGDMTAIIWFEKTRGKRSERVHVVNEDQAVAIQRQLAGMSTEQLQRVANGESPLEVLGDHA